MGDNKKQSIITVKQAAEWLGVDLDMVTVREDGRFVVDLTGLVDVEPYTFSTWVEEPEE